MFTEYEDESSTEVNYYEAAFKTNLVDEVLHENRTGAQIASAHHIKRGTVNKWVSRLRTQHRLYSKGGRPRCLDSESTNFVREALQNNPTMSTMELKALINEQYRETHKRTHPIKESSIDSYDDVERKLQYKTLNNYILKFRSECGVVL